MSTRQKEMQALLGGRRAFSIREAAGSPMTAKEGATKLRVVESELSQLMDKLNSFREAETEAFDDIQHAAFHVVKSMYKGIGFDPKKATAPTNAAENQAALRKLEKRLVQSFDEIDSGTAAYNKAVNALYHAHTVSMRVMRDLEDLLETVKD